MKMCPSCQTSFNDSDNFCSRHECGGTELKSVVPAHSPRPGDASVERKPGTIHCPVRLHVKPGTNPRPGCRAILECRLTNLTDQSLTAKVRMLAGHGVTVFRAGEQVRLTPHSSSHPVHLEFCPESAGHHGLAVLIETADGTWFETRFNYEVSHDSAQTVINNITAFNRTGDQERNRIGDESVSGEIRIDAANALAASPIRTHEWNEAQLFDSPGPKRMDAGVVPAPGQKANRLTLHLRRPGQKPVDVCVFAGLECCFGKERNGVSRQVDIRLRLPPRDDPATNPDLRRFQRISREHAVIRFEETGPVWQNLNCGNGTLMDGAELAAGQSMPLRNGMIVRPADVTGLRVRMGRDEHQELTDYRWFVERRLNEDYQPSVGPVQALHLTRTDSLTDVESCIVMQHLFEIGRDRQCILSIHDPSLRMRHARILHLGGWFWVESLEQDALVEYRRRPLPLETLAPLVPGIELKLGELSIDVSAFQQHVLDCDCPEHKWE